MKFLHGEWKQPPHASPQKVPCYQQEIISCQDTDFPNCHIGGSKDNVL